MNDPLGTETRLTALGGRLELSNLSTAKLFSTTLNSQFTKIWKPVCELKSYTAPVFIVLKIVNASVKMLFLTYNEEILEEAEFPLRNSNDEEILVEFILLKLVNNNLGICQGIHEASVRNLKTIDVNKIFIEKYGENIYYRSRDCSRAVESLARGQLCPGCQTWIQQNLALEMTGDDDYKTEIILPASIDLPNLPDLNTEIDYDNFEDMSDDTCLRTENAADENVEDKTNSDNQSAKSSNRVKRCEACRQKFKTHQDLCKHMAVCNPSEVHTCHLCASIFFSKYQLKSHLAAKHGGEPITPAVATHQCPVPDCSKMFKIHLGKSMRNHLENVHRIDPGAAEEGLARNDLPIPAAPSAPR